MWWTIRQCHWGNVLSVTCDLLKPPSPLTDVNSIAIIPELIATMSVLNNIFSSSTKSCVNVFSTFPADRTECVLLSLLSSCCTVWNHTCPGESEQAQYWFVSVCGPHCLYHLFSTTENLILRLLEVFEYLVFLYMRGRVYVAVQCTSSSAKQSSVFHLHPLIKFKVSVQCYSVCLIIIKSHMQTKTNTFWLPGSVFVSQSKSNSTIFYYVHGNEGTC